MADIIALHESRPQEGWTERALQIMLEVAAAVSAGEPNVALQQLARLAMRATSADRSAILVVDTEDPGLLVPAAGAAHTGDDSAMWDRFRAMPPVRIAQHAATFHGERATAIDDVARSQLIPVTWKRAMGSRSLAFAPLRGDGDLLGIIAVDHTERRHAFPSGELALLEAIAAAAGVALTRARLAEAVHLRSTVIEALYRIGDTVARTSDLKAALTTLNRTVGGAVGIECTRLSFGDAGLAEMMRVAVATRDERALLRAWRRDGFSIVRADGEIVLPVTLHHRPAGVLRARARPADATRLGLLTAVAGALGEIAHKAKLRRTSERRAEQLAILADRERIARDLHDSVGQTLYGIGSTLQDVLQELPEGPERTSLASARALAAQGIADVRGAVYALSSAHVRERGLLPALRDLARRFKLATGVRARVTASGTLPPLDADVEHALYRTVYEALVNVERHARATGVVVQVACDTEHLVLTIRDDGVGLGQRDAPDWRSATQLGMRAMARSIEGIGGTFSVRAAEPRGLLIRGDVPLARASR